jgi:hypothetical protein
MKKILFIFFCTLGLFANAQEDERNTNTQGTIRVQKKGTLHSVLYDDVNFRLVCRDIYGNILDSAVVAFDLDFTVKGIAYSEKTVGCFISKINQQRLSQLDGMVSLMFSNVKAKDKYGNIISFPGFKAQTGKAREREDY